MSKTTGLIFPGKATEYVCPHCGKAYKSAESLNKHIEEKHSEDNKE